MVSFPQGNLADQTKTMTKNQDNVAQPRILLEADSYEHIETTGGGPNLK